MGQVIIQPFTTKYPIQMIGMEAGVCYGSKTDNIYKNYKRGIDCLKSNHGRTWEFPDVYMILDGYSARVIREWYTHIGGSPTRVQSSTRYIDYKNFEYYTPPSIAENTKSKEIYMNAMLSIQNALIDLNELNTPKEDVANLLPLGMKTKIVCKHNFRNLASMSNQRMCNRAYHEYRELFHDLCNALSEYSKEWDYLVQHYFKPKCEVSGFCTEAFLVVVSRRKRGEINE